MKIFETVSWSVLALIHLLPAAAFFAPALVTRLYGAAPGDPVFVLLQHRAALFFSVFTACAWAAFDPASRPLASVIAAISMMSFLWLWISSGRPAGLRTIATTDLAGLPFLAVVVWRPISERAITT